MDSLEIMMNAGLCLIVGTAAFVLRAIIKTTKLRRAGQRVTYPGDRVDMYMAILWGGIFLVNLSSLIRHMQSPGPQNLSWLSLTGFASVAFVLGVYAGRLLLRMEIRRQARSEAMS